ncbi:MAG TPA: SUMF1/EgtB/PvdO family nonheme iron enzyme [Prolixibacteraceae bacterium]|nr:SUMF1/EgtB/PvdO family nonheme iron enzyme [Prolixibacteraceae bacterium]
MKKATIYVLLALGLLFHSCQQEVTQYLPGGERKSGNWFEPSPYGMVYIPRGSYSIGPSDDEAGISSTPTKTVSVESFWMDDTEITNNEYRQFVFWVRDSIARRLLSNTYPDFVNTENAFGAPLDEPTLNWSEEIEWRDADYQMAMEELYIPDYERHAFFKEIDSRKLIYEYYWVDYQQAAKRSNQYNYETRQYEGNVVTQDGEVVPIVNRSSFLMHDNVPVYPDTLVWIRDFEYTYNEPFTLKYFSHVAFDDYPVVGITWKQARAFCSWRTNLKSSFDSRLNETPAHDFRLPTETEWELAARGGLHNTMYPWGSYYTRNDMGCFVANFKPLRGNYVADSPSTTVAMKAGSFEPNNFGLYDMSGNVAEWTSTAFFESAYNIMHDLNPEIQYDAKPDDPPALKRKVLRGGSWKDMEYYIRTSTRSFEYQDTAKSYVGFRCVRTSFKNDLQNR